MKKLILVISMLIVFSCNVVNCFAFAMYDLKWTDTVEQAIEKILKVETVTVKDRVCVGDCGALENSYNTLYHGVFASNNMLEDSILEGDEYFEKTKKKALHYIMDAHLLGIKLIEFEIKTQYKYDNNRIMYDQNETPDYFTIFYNEETHKIIGYSVHLQFKKKHEDKPFTDLYTKKIGKPDKILLKGDDSYETRRWSTNKGLLYINERSTSATVVCIDYENLKKHIEKTDKKLDKMGYDKNGGSLVDFINMFK